MRALSKQNVPESGTIEQVANDTGTPLTVPGQDQIEHKSVSDKQFLRIELKADVTRNTQTLRSQ